MSPIYLKILPLPYVPEGRVADPEKREEIH